MLAEQAALAGKERSRRPGGRGHSRSACTCRCSRGTGPDAWELIRDTTGTWRGSTTTWTPRGGRAGGPAPPPPLTPGEEGAAAGVDRHGHAGRRSPGRSTSTGGRPAATWHYIARLYFPGLPWDVQQRALRLFAEQVIPRARELAARGSRAGRCSRLRRSEPGSGHRLGLDRRGDTGGTFTDADRDQRRRADQGGEGAVHAGRSRARVRARRWPSWPPQGCARETSLMIFHGTTIATNALLTGGTARVVLATTAGFRDVLGYRERHPARRLRPGTAAAARAGAAAGPDRGGRAAVRPRRGADPADARRRSSGWRPRSPGGEPAAVAVSLLFSYLDTRHEGRAGRGAGQAAARRAGHRVRRGGARVP